MQDSFFPKDKIAAPYLVLARKYRPTTFKDMIGQDVLVRTFSNAISTGRVAHAFVLTGIRGVGKTTTARIIARALNCTGADDNGGITADPCGVCSSCVAIGNDRHQDVLEMDAASHTGVADIRELIDNSKYKPISARYKIYIIDEVHMLSNSAFNSLLKTLEEPPAHVKFVFATTEIRKIPITILSRCQRFDLKRVDTVKLSEHFKNIVAQEKLEADDDALKLIANVSGGSVRDGLSILDQAISHTAGKVTEAQVRDMLGLSDGARIYDLFENIAQGNIDGALLIARELYDKGADPQLMVQDLLTINHTVARVKHVKTALDGHTEIEARRCKELAKLLEISYLAHSWQMLLKGLDEVKNSFFPFSALEMLLIRLAYVKQLPSLEQIIAGDSQATSTVSAASSVAQVKSAPNLENMPLISKAIHESKVIYGQAPAQPNSIETVLKILHDADEIVLYHQLKNEVRVVAVENYDLTVKINDNAPKDLVSNLQQTLERITADKWRVLISQVEGGVSLKELDEQKEKAYIDSLMNNKDVKFFLNTFEHLEVVEIKNKQMI